jgi:hypothetical protein
VESAAGRKQPPPACGACGREKKIKILLKSIVDARNAMCLLCVINNADRRVTDMNGSSRYVAYNRFLCRAYGEDINLDQLHARLEADKFGPGVDGVVVVQMSEGDAAVAMNPLMNHRNGLAWARSVGEVVSGDEPVAA